MALLFFMVCVWEMRCCLLLGVGLGLPGAFVDFFGLKILVFIVVQTSLHVTCVSFILVFSRTFVLYCCFGGWSGAALPVRKRVPVALELTLGNSMRKVRLVNNTTTVSQEWSQILESYKGLSLSSGRKDCAYLWYV